MKNLICVLICVLGVLSCKKEDKDPCETVTCLNGGICDDGTCICINGFSGQLCETPPDPCAGITCLNGGTCANGICNCPTGYTGSDCSQQATPDYIEITSVKLTKWPNIVWDPTDGSGPDVYFRLILDGTVLYSNLDDRFINAEAGNTISWNTSLDMQSPDSEYLIEFYDYETLVNDAYMGGVTFTPYSSTNGFPSKLVYNASNCTNCDVFFELDIEYHF